MKKGRLYRRVRANNIAIVLLCGAAALGAFAVASVWLDGIAAMLAGLTVLLAATLLASSWFARRLLEIFDPILRGAERFSRGDLRKRIVAAELSDLHELADSLNRMAEQLDKRLSETTRQRNERDAILESMREGVVAIDPQERILSVNRAAERLLGIVARRAPGRLLQEEIRHVEFQRFVRRALAGQSHADEDATTIHAGGGTVIQLQSAPLRDAENKEFGVLVILADVTRLHQLENLRREFVANVSHELRTPITSIKGFAETLLDGGLEDEAEARRFVEIIGRQSDRLGTVIEDLLALSRLDRTETIEKALCRVRDILGGAVEACHHSAIERGATVEIACDTELQASANEMLLTQAVTNLLENAIKYGGERSTVRISARRENGHLDIRVADNGPGIAEEHLPRIFERFYRVDKARSRDAGGTGLGLSIVKNVAQAHGGEVLVESRVGAGSAFTLRLPATN